MNSRLQWVNLAGVVLLAVLSAWQWTRLRRAELDRRQLEQLRQEQEARLRDQSKRLEAQQGDLEFFRRHAADFGVTVRTNQARLATLERERETLMTERDRAQSALTQWVTAVQERDRHLEREATKLRSVVEERNQLVERVNELAKRQNELVHELNDRTREFNELASRFGERPKNH
ncbi:MAG: hypothetical protein JNK85_05940 [Verrucomicrobiales bacterium]|nr:hypothetical protein [Verrucomicrobiales bacterium]